MNKDVYYYADAINCKSRKDQETKCNYKAKRTRAPVL